MTDSEKRLLNLLSASAMTRTFGVRAGSKTQASIRHGYLLALEEAQRALDDDSPVLQTASSPHHGR